MRDARGQVALDLSGSLQLPALLSVNVAVGGWVVVGNAENWRGHPAHADRQAPYPRIYAERVLDDTTLIHWATLIRPATRQRRLNHITDRARQLKLTRGHKVWLDSSVVATNIYNPVDSTLLADGVRVLTRTIQHAKPLLAGGIDRDRTLFRNRTVVCGASRNS
jgi:hypothetical protein